MDKYNQSMQEDNGLGLVWPKIPTTTNLELKDHILNMLNDTPFFKKDHKDTYNHIDEDPEISNYFNIQNVSRDVVMLRTLSITLKDAAKTLLKSLPPGVVSTWAQLKSKFIEQLALKKFQILRTF